MKKTSTAIIGACGEHYVAAYLSGHNLIVAMPRAGIPGFDLIVSNEKGGHSIRVQVKTGTQATRKTKDEGNIYLWSTSYAAIERDDKYLWYAYVWLNHWPPQSPCSNPLAAVQAQRQALQEAWGTSSPS